MIRVKGDPIEQAKGAGRVIKARVTKAELAAVTKLPDKRNGRPRVHASGAERQKAYRERRKVKP